MQEPCTRLPDVISVTLSVLEYTYTRRVTRKSLQGNLGSGTLADKIPAHWPNLTSCRHFFVFCFCQIPRTSRQPLGETFWDRWSSLNKLEIARIGKYLPPKTIELFVHAFVSSKLDFCDSLPYGIPKYLLRKLQSLQNSAARLVTSSKFGHLTPLLMQLH